MTTEPHVNPADDGDEPDGQEAGAAVPLREGAPVACLVCGQPVEQPVSGRTRKYCSQICRQQMSRTEKAGEKFLRQAGTAPDAPAIPTGQALVDELAQQSARMTQLSAALKQQTKATDPTTVRAQLAQAEAAKIKAEADAESLRLTLEAAQEFVDAAGEELAQVKTDAETKQNELEDALQFQRDQAIEEIADREAKTAVVREELAGVRAELAASLGRAERAEATAEERGNRVTELERANEAMRSMVADARAQAATAEAERDGARATAADEKERATASEQARRAAEETNARQASEISGLQAQQTALAAQLAEVQAQAAAEHERADQAEQALATSREKAAGLDAQLVAAGEKAAVAAAENERLAAALAEAGTRVRVAEQDATKAEAAQHAEQDKVAELAATVARLGQERDGALRAQATAEAELVQLRTARTPQAVDPDSGTPTRRKK
jgi:chromosome segregation ATPase